MEQTPERSILEGWARLTRFYGLSPAELSVLPNVITKAYQEMIVEIRAEEQMERNAAAAYPHIAESEQRKTYRRLARIAGLDVDEPAAPAVAPDKARGVLSGLGIGVVIEDA